MPAKFVFIRHGNAMTPVAGQDDKNRPLSPLGLTQALNRGQKIGLIGKGPNFHSPARRTKETGQLAVAHLRNGSGSELTPIPELFSIPDSGDDEKLAALFAKLKYSSLAEYYRHDTPLMERCAKAGADGIRRELNRWQEQQEKMAESVVVFGHAVILQAIAVAMFPDADYRVLGELILGEAEGFMVLEDGVTIVLHHD